MPKMWRLATRKTRIARFSIPVGGIVAALLILTATAAQAVGPLLSGNITGFIGMGIGGAGGVTITQAVRLDTSDDQASDVVNAADYVIGVSDGGDSFTAAIEAFENTTVTILLDVVNNSEANAFARITMSAPSRVTIDVDEGSAANGAVLPDLDGVQVAALNAVSWLIRVPPDETGGDQDLAIKLTGSPPGFYDVTAVIAQVSP